MHVDIAEEGESPFKVPVEFIEVAVAHADLVAHAAGVALRGMKIPNAVVEQLPKGILPELGALELLRILESTWQEERPPELPSFKEAQDDVLHRIRQNPSGFHQLKFASLSLSVFRFCSNSLAWVNPNGSQSRFTLADDDSFLDCLAEVLWDTRHQHDSPEPRK